MPASPTAISYPSENDQEQEQAPRSSTSNRPFSSSLVGTPRSIPSIPNIPPRNTGSPALAGSVPRPQAALSSRRSSASVPPPTVAALGKKEVVKPSSQGQSNLAAALSSSPAQADLQPSALHQQASKTSLRPPSAGGNRSGTSTPINDSAFSNLAEIPDEEKARILRRHLVSAQERQAGSKSQGGTPGPEAPSPAEDQDGARTGSAVGEGSSDGADKKADDPNQFPIPYDVVGGDVTLVFEDADEQELICADTTCTSTLKRVQSRPAGEAPPFLIPQLPHKSILPSSTSKNPEASGARSS